MDAYGSPFIWGLVGNRGQHDTRDFPKLVRGTGTLLGVVIIRMVVFRGLYWGPPILGNWETTI